MHWGMLMRVDTTLLFVSVESKTPLPADRLGQLPDIRMDFKPDLAAPTPEAEQAQRDSFDPLAHAFIDALQQLFPRRTRAEVACCYQLMLGATLHFLSDVRIERLSRGTARAADPMRQPSLVAFVAAGFRAVLQSAAITTRKAHR